MNGQVRCDAFGCEETHPLEHDFLGEPSFGPGRWLGWVYLDLNRPDLFPRVLRFCSLRCCFWWMDAERVTHNKSRDSPLERLLDKAIRAPKDEVAQAAALKAIRIGGDA